MAGSGDRRLPASDPASVRTLFAVLIALGALFVGLFCWPVYQRAGEPMSAADQDGLLRLAAMLLLLGSTFWGFGLWQQLFEDPGLEVLLVAPLSGAGIFWRLWRRHSRWWLLAGAVACFPAWAWLLGRDAAPDAEVAAWLFPAVPLALAAWVLTGAALGAFLAPLGPLAPGLPLLAMPLVARAAPELEALLGPLARPWHGEAWRSATGWHPVAVATVAPALVAAVLLAATHLLLRFTASHERLIRRRTRQPSARWRLARRETQTQRAGSFLVRRLDAPTRALWQLCRGDEAPQAFVRHLPAVAVLALASAALPRLVAPHLEDAEDFAGLFFAGVFLILGIGAARFLLQPSVRWRDLRSASQDQPPPFVSAPLREIFPVEIRAYMKVSFVTGFGIFTLILLLFLPLFVAGSATLGEALGLALALWLTGLLFAGLTIVVMVPATDPRRPRWSLAKVLGRFLIGLALCGLAWIAASRLAGAGLLRPLAELAAFLGRHPGLALAGGALLLLLFEVLLLRRALSRHRRRWFDAAP